ncbi:MAG: NAD-dependent epimerase/dehydratase family protein, partial [Candidatus Binatia bacterium]
MANQVSDSARGNWREKNVLVTGANGFLGSWVTKALVDEGARVICLIKEDLPLSLF